MSTNKWILVDGEAGRLFLKTCTISNKNLKNGPCLSRRLSIWLKVVSAVQVCTCFIFNIIQLEQT